MMKRFVALSWTERNPYVALWVFSAISACTTWTGLRVVMREVPSVPEEVGLAITAGLTLVIQCYLVSSILQIRRTHQKARLLGVVAMYLALMLLSVSFSYSFYFQAVRGAAVAAEQFLSNAQNQLRVAQRMATTYEGLSTTSGELQTYALSQSRVEQTSGGTCGSQSSPGSGARSRLWDADARVFSEHRAYFATRGEAARDAVATISAVVSGYAPARGAALGETLFRATSELSELTDDVKHQRFGVWLRNRLSQATSGFGTGAARFTCIDSHYEQLAGTLLAHTLPTVTVSPARWYDPNDRKQSISVAFDRALELALGAFRSLTPPMQERIDFSSEDFIPLFCGLFVDVLILISSLTIPSRFLKPNGVGELMGLNGKPKLDPEMLERVLTVLNVPAFEGSCQPLRLYEVLQSMLIRAGKLDYLLVPIGGAAGDVCEAHLARRRAADVFHQFGVAELAQARTDRLPRELHSLVTEGDQPPGAFSVYTLDRRFCEELLREAMMTQASAIRLPLEPLALPTVDEMALEASPESGTPWLATWWRKLRRQKGRDRSRLNGSGLMH